MQENTRRRFLKRLLPLAAVLILFVAVTGCAPQSRESVTPESDSTTESNTESNTSGVSIDWSMDSDCSLCHKKQDETLSDQSVPASVHASNGETCISCHDDETGMSKAHEGAGVEGADKVTRLKDSVISQDTCLACHADYQAKTADFAGLVDSEGTTVDPHNLPAGDGHKNTTCMSCHKQHSSTPIEENSQKFCVGCHHEDVYECYTCHE